MQPELAGTHDLGSDVVEIVLRIVVVQAGCAFAAVVTQHTLLKGPRRDIGTREVRPVLAERIVWRLVCGRCETIERDKKIDANCHIGAPGH